jgi:hypothetical protein
MMLSKLLFLCLCASTEQSADAPRGSYVEARSASVFAGACHYNGELVTAGREALLAWHVESGAFDHVDLSGLDVAAVCVADDNLSIATAARKSVVYVDRDASAAQRTALVAWVRTQAELGELARVEALDLDVRIDPSGKSPYRVSAPQAFELAGALLPDRACCKMPFDVWYEPLARVQARVVGHNDTFRVEQKLLARTFSLPDQNASFVARFGPAPAAQPR